MNTIMNCWLKIADFTDYMIRVQILVYVEIKVIKYYQFIYQAQVVLNTAFEDCALADLRYANIYSYLIRYDLMLNIILLSRPPKSRPECIETMTKPRLQGVKTKKGQDQV